MGSFSKLQWMDAVRQTTDIPAEQRLVIEDIGSTADQDGSDAWRDNKMVADRLKVHTRTVTRARENAAKHGLWVETRSSDHKHTARYRLTMPSSRGDSTVHPPEVGVTPQSTRGDSTVQEGRQQSPLGVTPQSPASVISSGTSSDSSSEKRYVSNAREDDDTARLIAEWSSKHTVPLAREAEEIIYVSDCTDYYDEECA